MLKANTRNIITNQKGGIMAQGKNVTTYLSADEVEALDKHCAKEGLSTSRAIKTAIRALLKLNK